FPGGVQPGVCRGCGAAAEYGADVRRLDGGVVLRGLGTAPFLAFLMSICSKAHAATQYALLSALFGLTRALSGVFSGVATEGMGYAAYFTATFFLAWPAFLWLPWVKDWAADGRESQTP